MMDHMVVCNVVEEKPPLPAEEISIYSCSCSALKVPLLSSVMRKVRRGMMEISNHYNCIEEFISTGKAEIRNDEHQCVTPS